MRNKLSEVEREKIVSLAQSSLLEDEEGKLAIDYLKSSRRNFDDVSIKYIIDKFKVGYMPSHVLNFEGKRHEFAGRVIMPLFNQHNKLIALSSRDWRDDAFMSFFHESFNKSNFLYGLNLAKENILEEKYAVVVEGEFDVMYLHSKGITNAVGCMGSTLQLNQMSLLMRYCRDIFIVFDGDKAGKNSTYKTREMTRLNAFEDRNKEIISVDKIKDKDIGLHLEEFYYGKMSYGLNIIPVTLGDDVDPDDYVREKGKEGFIKLLNDSRNSKNKNIKDFFKNE